MKKRLISLVLAGAITLSLLPLGALRAYAQEGTLYGDADGNGTVELLDVNLMERYIQELATASDLHVTEADVNADGVVDETDVEAVKEYLVGNRDSLTPVLHTLTFNTDGGGEVAPIQAGEGFPYRGEIPNPAKDGYIFVQWVKEDGSVYYPHSDVVEADMTLTATYEEMEPNQELNITSFSLDDQPTDVSFTVQGSASSADEVKALFTLMPKDGSDPVEVAVGDNQDGTFTIYAPGGFNPGASYELTLADGLNFADKESMFRTAYFIIHKEEVDNLQYNPDLIFIQDTDEMNYTVNGETTPVLESALVSNDESQAPIQGSFTMTGGNLKAGDMVCIYENTDPRDRDYTQDAYWHDAVAYIRITGVDGTTYQFESLNEEDTQQVLAMPATIPYQVAQLPQGDGQINKDAYDSYTWAMLGNTELPTFTVGDFVVFYTQEFDQLTQDSQAVYGQITATDENTISYKRMDKDTVVEAMEDSMDLFVSQEVEKEVILENLDEEELEEQIKQQAQESGFAQQAADQMFQAALDTPEVQDQLLDIGVTQEELLEMQNSASLLGVGAFGGRTKFYVDGININPTLIYGTHFKNGVGVRLDIGVSMHVERKMPNNQISELHLELTANLTQEVALDLDAGIDYHVKWYLFIPVLKKLDVTVSIDVQDYSALSVGAKMYTVRDQKMKKKWTAISETITGPNASPSVQEAIRTLNTLAAKIKTYTVKGLGRVEELQEQYDSIKSTLPYVEVDGTRYTLEELELELEAIDVSESFEETLMAKNQDEARTGMEQLMERYQEMLEQESDWVDLFNLSLLDREFHINVLAVRLGVNIIGRANVNLAVGADLEYQAGKRYTFWLHILDLESGSSEMDLIDERFGFQFYVMGTLGFKAGVKVEVGVGLLSTSLASIGANLEFGLYLKLYGYLIYYYEKLRPAGSTVWNTTEEMLGALYLDFGIYVTAKFKAQALANLFVYEPTIFDYEHSLATAGERASVYDFALRGSQNDILYVQDANSNSLDGISMPLSEIQTTMKTMDLVTGALGQTTYAPNRFVATFTDSHFSLDEDGNIVVDVPEGVRYLRCDMRLAWKSNKLAFSKFDTDITIPVVWTNMSQSELNEKFTASVAVGNLTDGYQTVWTGRYGRLDVFDLPAQEEILELIGYYNYETDSGNLKYVSVEGYQDQSTGLSLTGDKTFYFNVTPKEYTLTVRGVQDEKGNLSDRTYTALFGEAFPLDDLKTTGANDPAALTYTMFQGLTDEQGEAVTSMSVDMQFAQEYGGQAVLNAHYLDTTLTATYNFVGLGDIPSKTVKFQSGTTPYLDGLQEYVEQYGGENVDVTISPTPAPTSSSITYTVICKITEPRPKYTITFDSQGGTEVTNRVLPQGAAIYPPTAPTRTGYTFAGWYADQSCTQPYDFTNAVMPGEDFTLYAKWDALTYTVNFEAINGDNPPSITVAYDSYYGDLPTLAHDTLRFLGWYTQKDGGTEVTKYTVFTDTANQTLYAHWGEKVEVSADWIQPTGSYTYDKEGHAFAFEVNVPDGYDALSPEDFTVTYLAETPGAEWTTDLPVNAGPYGIKLKLTNPCNSYVQNEVYLNAGMVIEKADPKLSIQLYVTKWVVSPGVSTESDGTVQFELYRGKYLNPSRTYVGSFGTEGFTIPEEHRNQPGGFYLRAYISEGTNHKAGSAQERYGELYEYGDSKLRPSKTSMVESFLAVPMPDGSLSADGSMVIDANAGSSVLEHSEAAAVASSVMETTAPTAQSDKATPISLTSLVETTAGAKLLSSNSDAEGHTTMTLSPEQVCLHRGKEFQLTLNLNQAIDVWGILANVDYDPETLELTSYTLGNTFTQEQYRVQEDLTAAPFRLLATLDEIGTTSAQGAFVTLNFKVKETAPEKDTTISLSRLEVVGESAPVSVEPGQDVPMAVDETAPVLEGIADGQTYQGDTLVTVVEPHLQSVTVNGKEVEVTDGTFTLSPTLGELTVVATDYAGNQTTVTVTVEPAPSQNSNGNDTSTGDTSHLLVWVAGLLMAAGGLLSLLLLTGKRRKHS